MLYKEIPFLRIIIPLYAGVISGFYLDPDNQVIIFICTFCFAFLLISVPFDKSLTNSFFGISFFLALVVTGFLLYKSEKKSLSVLKPEKTDFICTVSDFPENRENSFRTRLKFNSIIKKGESVSVSGSIMVYFKKDTSINVLLPGDILKISCIPTEIINRGNPCEFDYRFYMENQGIRYMAFAGKEDIKVHKVPDKRDFRHKALIIRERIIDMYRNRGITGRNLALIAAMTVGEKGLLEQDQKEIFVKAGIMHIMAVSGLHAVVLSMFVFNLLFFLKGRFNILRIIVALLILWSFAFVTGLTPSVMRATLMFSFIQAGNLLKRPANSMNSVMASAFVLIIIRPSVLFDAGFLLSYSAVIFIIAFYRELWSKLNFKNFIADKIWQSAVVTIAAQAGTMSLSVMLFNRFPVYFLVTNLIIVPLSSLVIITGSLIPLLYPVVFLSEFFAQILNYLTVLTEYLTEKAASLPGSTIDHIGMTISEFVIMTAIIACIITVIIRKEIKPVNLLLFLILIYTAFSVNKLIKTGRSNELIVYNVPGSTITGIRSGRSMYLYSSVNEIPSEVIRHCSTLGIKIKKTQHFQDPVCLKAGNKKILIAENIDADVFSTTQPEIIILSGKRPLIKDLSASGKIPEMIIASSEVSSGFRLPSSITAQLRQPVHYVRKSGAYLSGLMHK